jgi:hypothetical protein
VGVQPSDEACSGRPARHHFHRTLGVTFRRQWSGFGGNLPLSTGRVGTRTHSPVHPAGPGRRPGARRQLSPAPTLAERILAALPLVKRGALADRNGVRLLNVLLSCRYRDRFSCERPARTGSGVNVDPVHQAALSSESRSVVPNGYLGFQPPSRL